MDLAPDTQHGTISHDCLTTAMFSSAQSCYFLPRVCVQKINGAHWSTFYNFASYSEAHTPALRDIKRGNDSSCGTAEVTLHMTTQRAQSGGQRVCIGHKATCQNATKGNRQYKRLATHADAMTQAIADVWTKRR